MAYRNNRVKDVMTAPVVAVTPAASFKELAVMLRRHRVSALPVVNDDTRLIGIVSEADLLAKEALNGDHGWMIAGQAQHREQQKADGVTAGDLMTRLTVTVTPDDTIEQAARLMYHLRVKRLPVVDPGGQLVGIVSRSDLLAVYDRPDDMILAEITGDVIQREMLTDPAPFTVTVINGIVTVSGSPETAELGRMLVEKIRHVPGVVDVHDELSYPTI
jgi:CBS domain-containing protein